MSARQSSLKIDVRSANFQGNSDSILGMKTPKPISKRRSSAISIENLNLSDSRPGSARSSIVDATGSLVTTPRTPLEAVDDLDLEEFAAEVEEEEMDYFSGHKSGSKPDPRASIISISSVASLLREQSQKHFSPANFDFHQRYKMMATNRTRKLKNFFGDQPPLDICVREIEKEGLKALLQSKVPLCYFLYSVLHEFSSENLFFFIELEQYESYSYTSQDQILMTARHIYRTYLSERSHLEVNIDDKVRRAVVEELRKGTNLLHAFDEAKRAVYLLLETSFVHFLKGEAFARMDREIGKSSIPYSQEARQKGIHLLLEYLEQQEKQFRTNPHTEALSFSPASRQRFELLKAMIFGFMRTVLGADEQEELSLRTQRMSPPPPSLYEAPAPPAPHPKHGAVATSSPPQPEDPERKSPLVKDLFRKNRALSKSSPSGRA
ncbi:uncharacterized protein VTP21DRAFT_10189 [Calcarisporiella thermophila]|uniref:uncharacterized protein n=1 Tax=Calcarisporiella thermophila TaxID=911321 RepID=UPI00374394B0